MSEPFISGIFGLVGMLVGGLVQFWFGCRATEKSRWLELKSQACADYLNSIASIKFAPPEKLSEAKETYTAAKTRLCVFGDSLVIEQVVSLEKTSLDLGQTDAQQAFIALLQVMRGRGIPVGQVDDSSFQILLLGSKPSNQTITQRT